jgi:hypothetical protein
MQKENFHNLNISEKGKIHGEVISAQDKSLQILNLGCRLGFTANFFIQLLYPRKEYYKSEE